MRPNVYAKVAPNEITQADLSHFLHCASSCWAAKLPFPFFWTIHLSHAFVWLRRCLLVAAELQNTCILSPVCEEWSCLATLVMLTQGRRRRRRRIGSIGAWNFAKLSALLHTVKPAYKELYPRIVAYGFIAHTGQENIRQNVTTKDQFSSSCDINRGFWTVTIPR